MFRKIVHGRFAWLATVFGQSLRIWICDEVAADVQASDALKASATPAAIYVMSMSIFGPLHL